MTTAHHDQFEAVARRAGSAVRAATQEVPVTVTDIVGLDSPPRPVRRRWTVGIGLATAAAAVVAAGAYTLAATDDEPSPVPAGSPKSLVLSSAAGRVSLSVPSSWKSERWGQHVLNPAQLASGARPPGVQLDPDADGTLTGARVSVILAESVPAAGGPDAEQEPLPADLGAYLATIPGLQVSGLTDTTVDGVPATRVDLRLPPPTTRDEPSRADLFCLGTSGGFCQPVETELLTNRYVVVPTDGGAVVVVAEAPEADSAEAYAALRTVLDGLTIASR